MKNQTSYSARTMRPMSTNTVNLNRKPITITGNLAVLIVLGTITIITMLLINLGLMQW